MAENGTGSEKLILAILGVVTLGKNGTEIYRKNHIEWLEQVPPVLMRKYSNLNTLRQIRGKSGKKPRFLNTIASYLEVTGYSI